MSCKFSQKSQKTKIIKAKLKKMITLVVDFHSSTMYLQSQKFLVLVTTLKYFFQSVRKILSGPCKKHCFYWLLCLKHFLYWRVFFHLINSFQLSLIMFSPFVTIFWGGATKTWFSIYITHSSVNFIWFVFLRHPKFDDRPLFKARALFNFLNSLKIYLGKKHI